MPLLETERATLEQFMPGLDASLSTVPLAELEQPKNVALDAFRKTGGPGLVIPTKYGGKGANAVEAIRIQRALGSRAPSLSIAATMHNFSVATLVEFSVFGGDEEAAALLGTIAEENLLVASGFAEGRSGTNVLAATMEARPTEDGGYVITGRKKPCSMTYSMDLLTASAMLRDGDKPPQRAILLVPSDCPGIERQTFWQSMVLTGTESHELILNDVVIPGDFLFLADSNNELDPVELLGYLWFQLMVTASYLGVATSLVERVVKNNRGSATDRAALGIEVEGAMSALEGVALGLSDDADMDKMLARSFYMRYSVQGAIERASMKAAELLGGMSFICSSDVGYLLATCRALAFHPPSRSSMVDSLATYLGDGQISVL